MGASEASSKETAALGCGRNKKKREKDWKVLAEFGAAKEQGGTGA